MTPKRKRTANNTPYPLSAARALALDAQGLATPPDGAVGPDSIYNTIERIGWLQIDTLQMVRRSQYLTLWSRLGKYDPEHLDGLLSGDAESGQGRRLFEYWRHAACMIPLDDYRYSLPTQRAYREGRTGWYRGWIDEPGNRDLVQVVLEHIRDHGASRSSDFERDGVKRGSWWDWKPAKRALEALYNQGDVMVASRVNFQRVYDLKERVLPEWVSRDEPTEEDATRWSLEKSIRRLGICDPRGVADYVKIKRTRAKPVIDEMIADGTIELVPVQQSSDATGSLAVHREDIVKLDAAADGALEPGHVTFLNPFDNLFWARDRDEQFWGFNQILEAYKREPDRIWGYYSLPILFRDRLVGRFDPKLERQTGVLRVKKLHLEPGVKPEDDMVASIAGSMRDFLAFHDASDLVIEHSNPSDFGTKLLAAM
ncbi:MAG: winged helix-turn-helix domain-containing protein [SAR202 cluster bacterium]|nr:crosslink repair DNA glycosylase YcaQ family protein [SAR202 cluster bacterium]MQG69897.1 winged helix-turn-helix domain-containing protein [SAR202 cluster bacterium]|tara:strand:- start:6211 stop:7488 length:1278 start_codon:yes stop_codon:yes gene_type:complete